MAAYNGWMGDYNVPNIAPQLSQLAEASDTVRTNMQNRAVGEAAATGKLSDAANVAFKQGNVKTGLAIKDLDDERKLKVGKIIGEAALNADTPEKWAQLQASVAKRFPGEELEPFEERDGVVSMYRDYYKERDDARADAAAARAERNAGMKAPSITELYDEQTGQPYKAVFNPQTGGFERVGGVKAPSGTQLSVGPDGQVSFVQGSGMKPLTEAQSKDTVFVTRAAGALPKIDELGDELTSAPQNMASGLPFGNYAKTAKFQQAEQAGKEFLQAILRKDTGAAITAEETAEYGSVYLPRPGDSPEVLAQKQESRRRAVKAIEIGLPPQAILQMEKNGVKLPGSETQGRKTKSGVSYTVEP
jgi:hypothetical protein